MTPAHAKPAENLPEHDVGGTHAMIVPPFLVAPGEDPIEVFRIVLRDTMGDEVLLDGHGDGFELHGTSVGTNIRRLIRRLLPCFMSLTQRPQIPSSMELFANNIRVQTTPRWLP